MPGECSNMLRRCATRGGGGDVVAVDIADHERRDATARDDRVLRVPDLVVVVRGQVPGGEVKPGLGQSGQHGVWQCSSDTSVVFAGGHTITQETSAVKSSS